MNFSLLLEIIKKASIIAMFFYELDNVPTFKEDNSPLTAADLAVHQFIKTALFTLDPTIPLVSEEGHLENAQFDKYWLIDPIDGTKEFLNKNGEFTVNIALIVNGRPKYGFVSVPAQNIIYYCDDEQSYKYNYVTGETEVIRSRMVDLSNPTIVTSRSHSNLMTDQFIDRFNKYERIVAGSSLKILYVAEGKADIYPRMEYSSEWDIAAAEAILVKSGGKIVEFGTGQSLWYNKQSGIITSYGGETYVDNPLINPYFVCHGIVSEQENVCFSVVLY